MNTVEIYDKLRNPPTEEEKIEKEQIETLKILEKQKLENEREEWLKLDYTSTFLKRLTAIINKLSLEVILVSSNKEVFNEVGYKKALEAKIISKVISYGVTGKYETE